MENAIIINGKKIDFPQIEWLCEQDISILINYLSLHILEDVYRNGSDTGLNAPLTQEQAKALFVLQYFLQRLQSIKSEGQLELVA